MINKSEAETQKIERILEEKIDWVEVAGIAMNHRLAGYLYNGLTNEQRLIMPSELRKGFGMLVLGQAVKQETLNKYIVELDEVLNNGKVRYAGLKGIIYVTALYQKGTRICLITSLASSYLSGCFILFR